MVAGLDIAYPLYRYAGLTRGRTHGRTDLYPLQLVRWRI